MSYKALQPLLKNPERPLYERFKPETELPMVSVVVCSYNGARTLRDCLNSLQHLHYPKYEVVFVDDGSKDNTQEIMKDFPNVRNIVQVNKGLSVARNVGIAAGKGEVIAFTDSDCMVDRDWLYFPRPQPPLGRFRGRGRSNISPPATDWIQATVGAAPGSPSHVLLTDTIAEHVPGCNMAYFKWALEEIGGFDPEYRKAGDDVDVCWRLMQRGYQIGFSPAAVVWHYRRFEVRTYFSQQTGYGEAEAMLRYKHLQYFGATGSAIWHGNVYSQVRMDSFFSKPIIYHGIFGTGLFQCIYPKRYSPFAALLSSLEWLAVTLFVFFLSIPLPWLRLVPLIMFGSTLLVGLGYMAQARIEAKFDSIPARLLLLYLAIMQPWRRAWARYFTWLRGKRTPPAVIATKKDASSSRRNLARSWQPRFLERDRPRAHPSSHQDRAAARRRGLEILPRYRLDELGHAHLRQPLVEFAPALDVRNLSAGPAPDSRGNFLNVSTFSSLVLGILLTFSLVTLASLMTHPNTTPTILRIALSVVGVDSFLATLWFVHGLRLRHRLAELVEVAAIRAGPAAVGEIVAERKIAMASCSLERTRFAELMRSYYSGRITNWEFEDGLEKFEEASLHEIFIKGPWCSYSDTPEYKFTDREKLTPEGRKIIARWILFLKSGQSYKWPLSRPLPAWLSVPLLLSGLPVAWLTWHWEYSFLGIFILMAVGLVLTHFEQRRFNRLDGEHELWPFRDQKSFEKALKSPPYLNGHPTS